MFTSRHNPAGGASQHFDNAQITELICRYQTHDDREALARIVTSAQNEPKS